MIIISFFWKNGCCKDRRVKSSNLSISICRSDCEEEGWSWNLESDGSIPYVSRMHLKNFVLSVACRHAIKSNIQTCLWKRASNTSPNIRFCIRTLKTAYWIKMNWIFKIRISRHPRPYKRLYGRNKLVNAKAFINKPRTKASNAMDV